MGKRSIIRQNLANMRALKEEQRLLSVRKSTDKYDRKGVIGGGVTGMSQQRRIGPGPTGKRQRFAPT